jgi:serine/threonine protein kinase
MISSECPTSDTLRELEAGELPDGKADDLLAHVESCRACAAALERLRRDSLDARILRRAVEETGGTKPSPLPADRLRPLGTDTEEGEGSIWDIPDYERVRLCGEGAFGTVWAVRDRVGLFRALKAIDLARLAAAKVRCRESTALEAYCRLVEPHPNLIKIFHVGVRGETLYYTMELADDARTRRPVHDDLPERYRPFTLDEVLLGHVIAPETAIEVVLRLLRGLARLHSVGLAHRDIKPANIVFVDQQPKISDIGMITGDTITPSNVGTPDYMPPDGRMDLTSDTFALGRILYELMTGRVTEKFPQLPASVLSSSNEWDLDRVEQLIGRACAARAENRFASADRMLEELESCRRLSYDSLFAELRQDAVMAPGRKQPPMVPVLVALINALPWIMTILLLILIVYKFL